LAVTALDSHSQKNMMLYDPKTAGGLNDQQLKKCNKILKWTGLPFDLNSPYEEFLNSMTLKAE